MSQKNFRVKNGLVVGNVTVDAATDSIANIANITASGNIDFSQSPELLLGSVANLKITGGSANMVLITDGNGGLVWGSFSPSYANYINYANFSGQANTANFAGQANTANVAGISNFSDQANTANTANFSDQANTANTANFADQSNISNIAYSVAAANITGTVSFATNSTTADTANSVSGSNVTGTVANATFATTAATANTALAVAWANVTGAVSPQYEIHVASNGNDTTGNGTVLNPYATVTKAVSVIGSGSDIILHPGEYTENVTLANIFAVTITAADSGGGGPFTPAIYGNVTVSGNSGAIAFKGVGVRNSVTHSSSGSLFLTNMQLGTGNIIGTLTKSGSGYLSVENCSLSLTSGANLTQVSITGAGTTLFSNAAMAALTVNNASAQVSVTAGSTTLAATLTSGTLNVFDSFMYTLGNSGFFAISSTSGTVNIRNSTLVNPNMTAARVNIGASTIFAYGSTFFDRANSNLGIQAGTTIDFQAIRAANTVTAANFAGNGAALSAITGANVTGWVANANLANTASSITLANVSGAGNIASINLNGNGTQALLGNGAWGTPNPAAAPISRFSTQTYTFVAPAFTPRTIIYDSVIRDGTGQYNTSNGRFTPTRAGFYQISCAARCFGGSSGDQGVSLERNGLVIASSSSIGLINGIISRLVYFNGTTDYVLVFITSSATSGSATQNQGNSFFDAYWVSE